MCLYILVVSAFFRYARTRESFMRAVVKIISIRLGLPFLDFVKELRDLLQPLPEDARTTH